LALPIKKRLPSEDSFIGFAHKEETTICAGFGLGDKILVHSLANVEMTSVHRMKIFTWM
jgi:hypothetical protein